VIFLLLLPESRFRWLSLAFGIAFTLNLLAAVPPTQEIGSVLRVSGALGVLGSLAMLSITVVVYTMLARRQGNVAPA